MNNYEFWEKYLNNLTNEIIKLSKEKEEIKVDLHTHTIASADGKQTVRELLNSTKEKGFDIIAITDHDTLDAYNYLYKILRKGLTKPLIIPGIEFTIDNREYGNQCHVLQLFINPKEEKIMKDVQIAQKATYTRSKKQFIRIKENEALQKIFNKKNINVSYLDYKNYIKAKKYVPEYDTLCRYLMEQLKYKEVTTFDVLSELEISNENDPYLDRKELKRKRYEVLKNKYERTEKNKYNVRFLLSLLAVRNVDDDWWDKPSCGSLTVNSYGQPKINELNKKYKIIFAHPTENSLNVVARLIRHNKNIIGVEYNIRNEYKNITKLDRLKEKYNLIKTIGSDSHDNTMQFYENMDFYKIKSKEILKLINKISNGKD